MLELDWYQLLYECVEFTRRLIQTPSMTLEESEIARLVVDEMRRLGFDRVWLDEMGNVSGRIPGQDPDLGALVLNSHLDHVDPGDLTLWSPPPYDARIIEGSIFGRGACDIKGPLAVQVYSMAALLRSGSRPRRDVVFSGVVQEEAGGAGALFWIKNLDFPVDLIVLGEPSSNRLSLGHRGIWQTWVKFEGRSVHASVPEKGDNPNYRLATFLERLSKQQENLASHPVLGATTVAPTIIEVDTSSPNVTPAWTRVLLDFRTAAESVNSLRSFIFKTAGDLKPELSSPWQGLSAEEADDPDQPIIGFYTSPESDAVKRIQTALSEGMGRQTELTSYRFATDGRHFARYREEIPIVGYSPGEEHLAHTVEESISLPMMLEALKGHVQLLLSY